MFEEENGSVLNFYCTVQTLDSKSFIPIAWAQISSTLFNILTVQKEISAVSLVLLIETAGMGLAVSLKKTQ